MKAYYRFTAQELFRELETSANGLSKAGAKSLLDRHGKNELEEGKRKTRLSILLSQFADVMILILVVAAGVSFFVGEHTDAFVILAIIIANAWMGYAQESKAEESIRMLKKMTAQYAMVIRDGTPEKLETSQLVPGDLVVLEAGNVVPADGRLIEVSSLKTDEASLTGESHSIEKTTEPIAEEGLVPGDQLNMVFKGTIVSAGSGKAIITATGMNTELGKIAGLMEGGDQKTPLQKRLTVFSKQLAVIVVVICALVFGIGWLRGEPPFTMFLTALSLAVAALPEALPAVITIALARGAARMVKQKALIRKLPAVETLGSVTYICTDKTGTLTQNVMTVEKVHADEKEKELLLHAMLLNNEVKFSGDDELLGDSTETAMVRYATEQGYDSGKSGEAYPLVAKLPFDSERMRMSTLHRQNDKWLLLVKGAPGKMSEIYSQEHRQRSEQWLDKNREWAGEGLRVLFFGYREFDREPGRLDVELEKELKMLGMVAMIDPPREEVIDSIAQCKTAGITTVMITGDQPLTAKAIAERLNITVDDESEIKTGAELQKLSEEELSEQVNRIMVYARVSPEQKLNIVKGLQRKGEFVAMTGDGVNDAPSLKQSDIGVAMGITGTDVSKEASDIILLDDNFSTIVKAIREGRRIYENIRKFILYVLSCNLSEILIVFLAPFFGFATPLMPIHILWINLVTDGLPGIALVSEPPEKDIMQRPPRPPKENLFAGGLTSRIITFGIIMTIAGFGVLWWAEAQGYDHASQQTMVFTTLCFVQLGKALAVRSNFSVIGRRFFDNWLMWIAILASVAFQLAFIYVDPLHAIFKTTYLDTGAMILIAAVTIASFFGIEVTKFILRKMNK